MSANDSELESRAYRYRVAQAAMNEAELFYRIHLGSSSVVWYTNSNRHSRLVNTLLQYCSQTFQMLYGRSDSPCQW